jgi:hypothetical protein
MNLKIAPTKLSLEYFRWRFWKVANWSERSLGSRRDPCERNQHKSELLVGDPIHQSSDLLNYLLVATLFHCTFSYMLASNTNLTSVFLHPTVILRDLKTCDYVAKFLGDLSRSSFCYNMTVHLWSDEWHICVVVSFLPRLFFRVSKVSLGFLQIGPLYSVYR